MAGAAGNVFRRQRRAVQAGVHARRKLRILVLRNAHVRVVGGRCHRLHEARTAIRRQVAGERVLQRSGATGLRCWRADDDGRCNRMDEDRNRIRNDAVAGSGDVGDGAGRRVHGRGADGVVRNAAAGVAIEGAAAHLAASRVDIGEAHIAGGEDEVAHRNGVAFAVDGGDGERRADLSVVDAFAVGGEVRRERNGFRLADDGARVAAVAELNRRGFAAAGDGRSDRYSA